jgi:hypothetical protein
MKNKLRNIALLASASAVAVLSSCGGGSTEAAYGTLSVNLTDAPACGYDAVNITVSKIRVHREADAGEGEAGWSDIIVDPARKIDLLTLTNGILEPLGQTELPAGRYTQMRLVLSPNNGASPLANSVVPTMDSGAGTETALITPSGHSSGIKLNGNFEVGAGATTELTLDFDACKSIVTRGNGSYGLKPVVTIIPMATSGAITGYIDTALAAASKPVVSAQINGVVVKTTVPKLDGSFTLAPLTAGTYTVVVTADSHASDVISGVPVTVQGTAALSTQASPLTMEVSAESKVSGSVLPAVAEGAVTASQSFAGGPTVTIKYQNADVVTGDYAMMLPIGAPRLGQYGIGTLPITRTAQPAIAGKYAIEASAATYQAQSQTADMVGGGDVSMDFTLVK